MQKLVIIVVWERDNVLSTPGVDYTTISLWTNCSECVTNSPPNENQCQCEFQSDNLSIT